MFIKYHLLFFLLIKCSESFKILTVFTIPSKSHAILGSSLVNILLNAGHEVTHITPTPEKGVHEKPRLHQVDVHEIFDLIPTSINVNDFLEREDRAGYDSFLKNCVEMSKYAMNHRNVQKLLRDTSKEFDLIIIEWPFSDLKCGLSAVFNCPYIWFSSTEPDWMLLQLIDDLPNPAFTSSLASSQAPPFNFKERAYELYTMAKGMLIKNVYIAYHESVAYEEIFRPLLHLRGRKLPPYNEVKYNASLMLGNNYVSMGDTLRLPQNYKSIGGYHINTDVKPLPEDLQNIMDRSINGVIYFSMGTNLKSKDMPEELKLKLLDMFSKLNQTVLWKFEEMMAKLPSNVHIISWAPQQSILAHKNCKLFITHGGLLSLTETTFFGIPIIGIPGFIDQFANVARAVRKGLGVKVDLSYKMAEDLGRAIEEVLTNSRYRHVAEELSVVYHDRPIPPHAELIHWVNHVVKTKGAPHLRSHALMLSWYQKIYLDLLIVILIVFLGIYAIAFFVWFRRPTEGRLYLLKKKL